MSGLEKKARNFFVLGAIAESLGMLSEAATNFFKALFAVDDAVLAKKLGREPKDHGERFDLLKRTSPSLYLVTDRLFSTYRRTYTQELTKGELLLVKKGLLEAFKNAEISLPTNEEIKKRFEELLKKRKVYS